MKIGLIDVDGHNFPNLALMKICQDRGFVRKQTIFAVREKEKE